MPESISFLLGAGFSAPMGYPIGNELNEALLNCTVKDFCFSSDGRLCIPEKGWEPGYRTHFDLEFEFCLDLIQFYRTRTNYFDYEEFYDFFMGKANQDPDVEALYKKKNYGTERDVRQMLSAMRTIYSQLIAHFLVDNEGNSWYDDAPHCGGPIFPGYTGLLNCLRDLSNDYLLNVHTLNHDLFFERLRITDWLLGKICDGFQELESPYYGKLLVNGRSYRCRLEYYSGLYDKQIRLYKLHGSKDYGIYYTANGPSSLRPEGYIKTRYGIGFGEFYKEINDEKGEPSYERCWVNYHADFLTGTTSKIERYSEPLLFKVLFECFVTNLKDAEKLIIIGYGAKDAEVNRMILENFDFKKKPVFIVDPYVGNAVKGLQAQLNATLITKHLEEITLDDFKAPRKDR